jgi:large subunit ribosomal protein L18e
MNNGPTNPVLNELIGKLKKTKKKSCLLVARKLESATRRRPEVNLWKLDKYTKEGEFVVVPGKVLSEGELSHKITLVAFNLSKKAEEKLKGKAKLASFDEVAKAKNVKVIA